MAMWRAERPMRLAIRLWDMAFRLNTEIIRMPQPQHLQQTALIAAW
jgi:hypothetical protein